MRQKLEPKDLLLWRRDNNISQGDLAAALGVSRKTVNTWEKGRGGMPDNLYDRLAAIARPTANNASASSAVVPKWITYDTAPHLYHKDKGAVWRKPIHPRELLGDACPSFNGETGLADAAGRVPWQVLQSRPYLEALASWRQENGEAEKEEPLTLEEWIMTQMGGEDD